MTSFVQSEFPRVHGGANRFAGALERAHTALARVRSPAGMASVLVAGGLAAVIVVAEQVVSAWTDGHLLVAWIAMWVIVFSLLALYSDAIRSWPAQWQSHLQARRQAARIRAADERTWSAAMADPRLMAELDNALLRAQQEAQEKGQPMPRWHFSSRRARDTSKVHLG